MTAEQEEALANLNDQYGAASWRLDGDTLIVIDDDGDVWNIDVYGNAREAT